MNRTKIAIIRATGLAVSRYWIGGVLAATFVAAIPLRADYDLLARYPCTNVFFDGTWNYTSEVGGSAAWGDARIAQNANVPYMTVTNDPLRGDVLEMGANWAYMQIGQFTFDYTYDPLSYSSNAFTMMLWYQAPEASPADFGPLIFKRGASFANNNYWQFDVWNYSTGPGNGRLRLEDANQSVDSVGGTAVFSNWVHYAVSVAVDPSVGFPPTADFRVWVKLFRNGHELPLINTTYLDLNWVNYVQPIFVGNAYSSVQRALPGARFSDIRFYNGALTAEQIRDAAGIIVLSIAVTNGMTTVSWESVTGKTYQVEKKTNPLDSWTSLGSPATATTTDMSVSEAQGVDPALYRVKTVP